MDLIEHRTSLIPQDDGTTLVKRSQTFGARFMEALRVDREAPRFAPTRDMDRVASVPAQLVDQWISQGFDFWKAKPKDILARLRLEGHEDFITTPKQL
jgi:hypothetical protein